MAGQVRKTQQSSRNKRGTHQDAQAVPLALLPLGAVGSSQQSCAQLPSARTLLCPRSQEH